MTRRKICKAKTLQVPDNVPKRGVEQYVCPEAERPGRQTKYVPGMIAFHRRSLETVCPEIGAIKLNRLPGETPQEHLSQKNGQGKDRTEISRHIISVLPEAKVRSEKAAKKVRHAACAGHSR